MSSLGFSGEQMMAVLSVSHAMVLMDGKIDDKELDVVINHLASFGVPVDDWKPLIAAGDNMEPAYAMGIIASMNYEQKKYVASLLGVIIIADNDINDKEVSFWRWITKICKLPTMSIKEAVENLNK